jgi:hypothetical protein
MSVQDMVAEFPKLTLGERLKLIEILSVSVQRELTAANVDAGSRIASADRLLGMLRPANGIVPNDEDVKQLIAESIMEKHA